jgi:hypothetical protein
LVPDSVRNGDRLIQKCTFERTTAQPIALGEEPLDVLLWFHVDLS